MICYCDMFPDPHDAGTISDDGRTECETTLRAAGPMISPHLFPNARFANATKSPAAYGAGAGRH